VVTKAIQAPVLVKRVLVVLVVEVEAQTAQMKTRLKLLEVAAEVAAVAAMDKVEVMVKRVNLDLRMTETQVLMLIQQIIVVFLSLLEIIIPSQSPVVAP
jgi:hypothetical protein